MGLYNEANIKAKSAKIKQQYGSKISSHLNETACLEIS
jgi:hypothetical protein